MAYLSPEGYHRHECKFCAYVWEHLNVYDEKHGDEGHHECPSCHRCNWSLGIYTGDKEPQIRKPPLEK